MVTVMEEAGMDLDKAMADLVIVTVEAAVDLAIVMVEAVADEEVATRTDLGKMVPQNIPHFVAVS